MRPRTVTLIEREADWVQVSVRAGTQTNCGGFAVIDARVERATETSFVDESEATPAWVIEAVFRGAREAWAVGQTEAPGTGFRFALQRALVHPVDGTPRRFEEAGRLAADYALREL